MLVKDTYSMYFHYMNLQYTFKQSDIFSYLHQLSKMNAEEEKMYKLVVALRCPDKGTQFTLYRPSFEQESSTICNQRCFKTIFVYVNQYEVSMVPPFLVELIG